MATYTKNILSGSTDGRNIKVAATATAGTMIHTGSSTATDKDEIWICCCNTSTSSVKLTIEFGGTTSPDDLIERYINPEEGLVWVVPGLVIKGNASALVVRAFAGSANVLVINGFTHRIVA